VFRRGDKDFYEIPQRHVEFVDTPLVWPSSEFQAERADHSHVSASPARADRAYDNDIIGEFYPRVRPFSSQKLGVYWRGPLELLDGSRVEVVLLEDSSGHSPKHSVALRDAPAILRDVADELAKTEFPSARAALLATERNCNRALYQRVRSGETKS